MEGIRIRIFGSHDCQDCKNLINAFNHYSLSFEFIDANDKKNEDLCDKLNIDQLPVVQAVYEGTNNVFLSHVGYIGPMIFLEKVKKSQQFHSALLEMLTKKAKENVNQEQIKVQIKEWKKNEQPCRSCNKKRKPQS
jgi:hypothetical protein